MGNEKQSKIDALQKELMNANQLFERGQYNKAYNIADRVYQESRVLSDNVLTFNALMILTEILINLGNLKSIPNLIGQGETLLQTFYNESLNEIEIKEARLLRVKGKYHLQLGDYDKSIEFSKKALSINEKLGKRKEIAEILTFIGAANGFKGNTDEALKVFKKSYKICEELDLKANKALILLCYGAVCFFYGEIERSKDFLNKSLMISEKLDYKLFIAMALLNLGGLYDLMGDFDGAMKTWERSLKIAEDIGYTENKVSVLASIIQTLIKEDDLELAEKNLRILKEICEQAKIENYDRIYRLNKALIMKTSLRARNRADAEEILKNLVNDTFYTIETKITVLLNLCDLLLRELQITGDMEILDEIQQYIEQLLEISEQTHFYFFMAELYLLQARLSLLTLNLKEAKRYFTQAQQIAENWGYNSLLIKIMEEKDHFLNQMHKWEKFKETDTSINERLELAQLDKQIERMLQNRSELTGQIIEEKVDVHKETKICMICRGEVSRYIYVCECDAIYCESCVKALVELENICWVCEAPIDQSRPIKHFKRDEVEIKKKITSKEDREPIRK